MIGFDFSDPRTYVAWDGRLPLNKTYKMEVRVRGHKVQVLLDGKSILLTEIEAPTEKKTTCLITLSNPVRAVLGRLEFVEAKQDSVNR